MSRQRGIALLLVVLLILALATAGAIVAGAMSASEVTDARYQGASVAAGFAADTGLERALKQFATGSAACGALGGGPFTVTTGVTFTTTAAGATSFDGVTPLPDSQCRVQVSAAVAGTNAARIVQGILDRNLLGGESPGFNDPVGGAGQWATTGRWDTTGGPDPIGNAPPNCNRAMYVVKPRNAAGLVSSGTATIPVVPAATGTSGSVTVRFNYRVTEVTSVNNNGCATDTGVAACPGATGDAQICFAFNGGAFTTFAAAATVGAIGPAVTPPACTPTTVSNPGAYATCASRYQQGTPTAKGQVLVPAPGTINSIQVKIYLRAAGNAREAWVDNIELINDTGIGIARVQWRDCSVMGCV